MNREALPDLSRFCRTVPAELPSLPLAQRHELPQVPAVYLALGEHNEVLYIGQSSDLSRRWLRHHRVSELQKLENVRLAWIELETRVFLEEVERVLIAHFSPTMNGLRDRPGSEDMSLPPVFPPTLYRLLEKSSKQLGVTREKLAMDALLYYIREKEEKQLPFPQLLESAIGPKEVAKRVTEANRKIAKEWWSTVSDEEKKKRALKAVRARWDKHKEKKVKP